MAFCQHLRQVPAAKGGFGEVEGALIPPRCCREGGAHSRRDVPAVGALDAVLHREDAALLGLQVVGEMGILGGIDRTGPGQDLLRYLRHDGSCLRRAQRAVDKVVLHVDNY